MGMAVAPDYAQIRGRFRNDDGSETAATWKAAVNAAVEVPVNTVFRLRIMFQQQVTGANEDLSLAFKVRFSRNSGAYTTLGLIGTTNTAVRLATSTHVANGDVTTQQLPAGVGSYLAGRVDNNNTTALTFSGDQQHTELEFIMELYGPLVSEGDTFDFRVYRTDDTALNASTAPRATATVDSSGDFIAQEQGADRVFVAYQPPQITHPAVAPLAADSVTLSWNVNPDYGVYD